MDQAIWKKRWRKAVFAARFLRHVPYVRMVGLNGSMVTGAMHPESDIDFFIVSEDGVIFLTKILTTIMTQVLGVRRHGNAVAGRVCLNRYATESFLKITPENEYHARVFHNLIPLYEQGNTYDEFIRENSWMKCEGYPVSYNKPVLVGKSSIQQIVEVVLHPIRIFLNERCSAWQHNQADHNPKVHEPGSVVILTAQELRFHLVKE